MKIGLFGLGYVGSVSAACLAQLGHDVVAIDVNPEKTSRLMAGETPVFEPGLGELVAEGVAAGRLKATLDASDAVAGANVIMVCVGTPSQPNGALDMSYVKRVNEEIAALLHTAAKRPVVCIRSTMLPGSHSDLLATLEAGTSMDPGKDFGFCVNPEFLREGSAIRDFTHPPLTLIGELDPQSGDLLAELYAGLAAPMHRVDLGVAEMVKYAGNAFHALKVVFANEIGSASQALGIDGNQVMNVFTQDTKLNISPRYLKPGFAYGGSCLGKDLRAMLYAARQVDIELPVLNAIAESNQVHIDRAAQMVLGAGKREVAIVGLSFKTGTDDLRESPLVDLAEQMVGKGMRVRIFDREVNLAALLGTNKAYIDKVLPHLANLLSDSLQATLESADVIVIGKPLSADDQAALVEQVREGQLVIDLVGIPSEIRAELQGSYRGIAW